jgi:hypothetical protein
MAWRDMEVDLHLVKRDPGSMISFQEGRAFREYCKWPKRAKYENQQYLLCGPERAKGRLVA